MTIPTCSLNNYYPNYSSGGRCEDLFPVIYHPLERLDAGRDPSHPELIFSPLHGVMDLFHPSKRRATVDRFCERLHKSNCTGSELAITYLREKYSKNLAAATISSSGGVLLSFFQFLSDLQVKIENVTNEVIGRYVDLDMDKGLKIGAIRTKLRALYAFIRFLVDKKVLSYEILHKKIRIQREVILPKAIPCQDVTAILDQINGVRDRAIILLLLRTGMRIGELLNVAVSDIHFTERKILLYVGEKNYEGRTVYYTEDAEKALKSWLAIRDPERHYLFYSHSRHNLSYVAAWTVLKKAIEAAGLTGKGYSLHSLRHTFATDILNAGLRLEVLQQLLGHRSIEITRRYARLSDTTREVEYFKAMTAIESGGTHEPHRVNSELQEVFEEKKFIRSYNQKLSS